MSTDKKDILDRAKEARYNVITERETLPNRVEKQHKGGNDMTEKLMGDRKLYLELPNFTGRNVKIAEIARATGKDPNYIRIGLQRGFLKFGTAFKMDGSTEYSYLCPDKKVWEETGYFREASEDFSEAE